MDTVISDSVSRIRPLVEAQRSQIFTDLAEITSFHSVHSTEQDAADHAHAAAWVKQALASVGLEVTELPSIIGTNTPTFIGTKAADPGQPTVLLYSHYDVVPAGDPAAWITPANELTEREGRWYARGAADCKGNLVMHLAALRSVAELGGTGVGIKFLVEGSEEQGGAELSALIKAQPELFQADMILIADSGNQQVGVPTLTTSLRGGAQLSVTVDTLHAAVHSGSFGGAAPDAVAALVRILDSLRDEHGRTQIDGVDTMAKWPGVSYPREMFRKDAGIRDGVDIMGTDEDDPADMVWARPAISITGFTSTPVEQAVNAVPPTATARLNLRVPAGMDAGEVAAKLAEHLRTHAPWNVQLTVDIEDVNAPFASKLDGPGVALFDSCLAAAYGKQETVKQGSGGSIPLCAELLEVAPQAELVLFGVEDPLAVIHSPNESVDSNEIRDIAVAEAAFLLQYGTPPKV
ncbi:dipeptidase [Corynebacterium sp. 35RC1]|nr:dipeptidase [Corynebacterium sp. 35RC1]